jgi:phytoene synthase
MAYIRRLGMGAVMAAALIAVYAFGFGSQANSTDMKVLTRPSLGLAFQPLLARAGVRSPPFFAGAGTSSALGAARTIGTGSSTMMIPTPDLESNAKAHQNRANVQPSMAHTHSASPLHWTHPLESTYRLTKAKERNGAVTTPRKEEQEKLLSEKLDESFEQCRLVTAAGSKTFYAGTQLMSAEQRKAVCAIYTWCRRTDDIVDDPRPTANAQAELLDDLKDWKLRLQNIWNGEATDSLDYALAATRKAYPTLSIQPFYDMIEGMLMDTPQLGQDRYQTWDELYIYCYRVASTVGLMTLPVLGTAPGYTEQQAKDPALLLGIGLQLTNILRDVGEDAARGRIYLPKEDMDRFGVTESQIFEGRIDENYKNLIKFEIERARSYYEKSNEGIPMLAPDSRLSVQAASDMYGGILAKIENNNYDNFNKRAFVPQYEKVTTVFQSFLKVFMMSKGAWA